MESEITHRHPPLLTGPQPLNLLHQSFRQQPSFLYEWAMSRSPPPPYQRLQEERDEKAQRQWSFRLSAVVSPSADSSDAIGAIEFDPAGRLLATAGIARKIRFYTLGSLLGQDPNAGPTLSDHSATCRLCICAPAKLSSLCWRPGSSGGGGGVIAAGDYDGVVTEYDAERGAGAAVSERDDHGGRRVWSVAYSASGDLGASGSDDGTVRLWDTRCAGGTCPAVLRAGGAVCSVEFDPEGGPWVAAGSADRRAYVFDVRAAEAGPVAVLGGHERAVAYVRFAEGARRVVTSGTDGTHRLWDWRDGRQLRAYRGHANSRSFIGMSVWRSAGLIGSGSESNEVFVYDLRWGEPIWVKGFGPRRPEGIVGAVSWRQVAAMNEEGMLAAGGSDGVLQIFLGKKVTDLAE